MALKAKTNKNRHRSHTTDKAIEELTKEELKGFHVQLPASLHAAFKAKTATNSEKMKEVIVKLIQEYVEKRFPP